MAAVKRPEDRSLRELLDGLILSQKKDIKAYSGGHLNEANLFKPPEKSAFKSWKSAKKDKITLVPRNRFLQTRTDGKGNDHMGETLTHFSLGTTGTIPLPSISKKQYKGTKGPLKGSAKSQDSQGSYSKKDDGILVEELKLPEIMLRNPTTSPDNGIQGESSNLGNSGIQGESDFHGESGLHGDIANLNRDSEVPQTSARCTPRATGTSRFEPKRQFLQGFQDAVTKKDQFARLKAFESEVLKVQDAQETHVLSGIKAVEKLETKLKQELISLSLREPPPNSAVSFQRLQVYSDTLENLIQSTPTFSDVLLHIKREYDDYISHLLASPREKHETLHHQMELLSARRSSNPRVLQFECDRVLQLEGQAKYLIDENQMLRKELQKELELAEETVEEDPVVVTPPGGERRNLDLGDQVDELHTALLEKLDQITALRNKLKTEYVPTSVCSHLQQCVKETEVETQRLTSQKDYYEKNISEMESDLQELIETADTTDKHSKRVWNRINAVNAVSRGAGQVVFGFDSESETDEEVKWNWYIS